MKKIILILIIIICILIIFGYTLKKNKNEKTTDIEENPPNQKIIIPSDIEVLKPKIPIHIGFGGFVFYDDIEKITLQIVDYPSKYPDIRYYHYYIYNRTGLTLYYEDWIPENLTLPLNITIILPGDPPYFFCGGGNPRITFYIWGNLKNVSYNLFDHLIDKHENITLSSKEGEINTQYIELNEKTVKWNFLGVEIDNYIGNFSIIDPTGRSQIWGNYGFENNTIFLNHGARFMVHGTWTIKLEIHYDEGIIKFAFITSEIPINAWEKYGFSFQ